MQSELPAWFAVALPAGILIGFIAIWTLVCALIAAVSGYRSLAPFRIDPTAPREGDELPAPPIAWIGPSRYRGGILKLSASSDGLALHIPRIFLFHPPVRIPWERIQEMAGPGTAGPIVLLDDRVRLRVPPDTLAAIRDAKARYAG